MNFKLEEIMQIIGSLFVESQLLRKENEQLKQQLAQSAPPPVNG